MNKHFVIMAIGLYAMALGACDKKKNDDSVSGGQVLIASAICNPDGMSGTSYVQLVPGIDPASYSNTNALPFSFMVIPQAYGNWVFDASLMHEKQTLDRFDRVEGHGLVKGPSLQLQDGEGACHITVVNEAKAYVSIWDKGKLIVFNPTTMTKMGEIDLSAYGANDDDPNPLGMVLRDDGLLFVSLGQIGGNQMPYPDRPQSDVLIIDTKTDSPLRVVSETTSGLSYPSRPVDPRMMFMDEQGDIYIGCMGYFGFMPTHRSGFLRIKKGSQEFDPDYALVLPETPIEGVGYMADYLCCVQYAGNGMLYALLQCNSLHPDPAKPNYLADHTALPVEINLKAKTIKTLSDIPCGNNFNGVGLYNGKILFGISSDRGKGFHIYDPATGQGTASPVINTTGEPFAFLHLTERW